MKNKVRVLILPTAEVPVNSMVLWGENTNQNSGRESLERHIDEKRAKAAERRWLQQMVLSDETTQAKQTHSICFLRALNSLSLIKILTCEIKYREL